MSKYRHFDVFHYYRKQLGTAHVNILAVQHDARSLNDRIALWVSRRVGTMWFCYALAALMFAWGLVNLALGKHAFDSYPFTFLLFCLGGIMQSLLMPLLLVAQNLSARHAELQSILDYHINQENAAQIKYVATTLGEQQDILLMQSAMIKQLLPRSTRMSKAVSEAQNG